MAKDPAFLFYTNDFDAATKFYTDEQVGVYLRLLMAQHQHGRLKESQVKFIAKDLNNEVLEHFKQDENSLYYNNRLESEIEKRKKYSESRRKNRTDKNICSTYDTTHDETMIVHMENENENIVDNTINNKKKEKIEKWNTTPLPEHVGELPAIKLGCAVELIKITKYIPVSTENMIGMWAVFKAQNLTGKKFYQSIDDVYSHFINWVKTQKFETDATTGKPQGAKAAANGAASRFVQRSQQRYNEALAAGSAGL